MSLFEKHEEIILKAIGANHQRGFWAAYPEFPKVYGEEADAAGKTWFAKMMNQNFEEINQEGSAWIGEEVSPFLQLGIGVRYPQMEVDTLISNAKAAQKSWGNTSIHDRAGLLVESLERVKARFFDIAYATMHTTGQAYMMSFQASGPHANDRALEAIALGFEQISSIASEAKWVKPMGKFDLEIYKNFKAIPKGIGLVIGCSTFPVWNTVPGLYADLISGNVAIVKPHPKAVLPIAIVVAELRKLLAENGYDQNIVQLAADSSAAPLTKQLAEHADVKLIDFTGGNSFGNYIETIAGKTTFTEKAGVNCAILDSVKDIKGVAGNIAFSACLYSGQMCTAPQNIFISETGIQTAEGTLSYDDTVAAIKNAFVDLLQNPKMGPHILGAIQSDITLNRLNTAASLGGKVLLESMPVKNEEFEHARTFGPVILELTSADEKIYTEECFGPIVFIIKTKSTEESLTICEKLSTTKGALTCLAWCTDAALAKEIEYRMNQVYTPVSFNFGGAAFVNQHAAFSDFHVTGGNPAGNATFTDGSYISKRYVWVGNRFLN
jgi:phenylacetic acid degradation protein paaN